MDHIPSVIAYRSPLEAWFWESGAWIYVYPVAAVVIVVAWALMFRWHRKTAERMQREHDIAVARMRRGGR